MLMGAQKPKSLTIDSVVIIDETEAESTEKTIIPDEILSEKELPPHLRQDSSSETQAKTRPKRQQFHTVQEIINVHQRMSKKYIVRRRGSVRAKVCLFLGLVGLFLFQVPVISTTAIILGFWELKAINKRLSPIAGKRWAQVGLALGFIGIGLMLVKVFFWLKLR
ncbi:MAG: DUF4190 domain-containing protein [Candidatus Poribacteria bacterium]